MHLSLKTIESKMDIWTLDVWTLSQYFCVKLRNKGGDDNVKN